MQFENIYIKKTSESLTCTVETTLARAFTMPSTTFEFLGCLQHTFKQLIRMYNYSINKKKVRKIFHFPFEISGNKKAIDVLCSRVLYDNTLNAIYFYI